MPRFYFHFAASGLAANDKTGMELADLADAHAHAVRLVDQATRYFDRAHNWSQWTVRICDDRGRVQLTVLFRSCLKGRVHRHRRTA